MRPITKALILACLASLAAPAVAQQITDMVVPVAAVDNPQQLLSLNVVDPNGGPIGDVVKVKTGSDGRASRILVMLAIPEGVGRVATMRAERLVFDRRADNIVAQFTAAELTQLALTATTPSGIDLGRSSGMVQRANPMGGQGSSDPGVPGAGFVPMGR